MPDYSWPPMEKRKMIGKRINRLDGPMKSSGRAKYPSDMNAPGLLYGMMLSCPHAHAKIKSVDDSAAKSMKGVTSIRWIKTTGAELQWAGAEIAIVTAESE